MKWHYVIRRSPPPEFFSWVKARDGILGSIQLNAWLHNSTVTFKNEDVVVEFLLTYSEYVTRYEA